MPRITADYYIDPDFYRVSVSLPIEWKYFLIKSQT
jgi:hypothetical protein